MSDIHFPKDHLPPKPVSKQTQTLDSVQHADAVNTDPDPQQNPSSKKDQSEQPSAEQGQSQKERAAIERGKDRRLQDRRQQDQQVLLNTRSGHDRRKSAGQRKDDTKTTTTTFGIDTKA